MKNGDYVRTRDGLIAKIMVIDNTSEYSEIILKTDTNDTIWCSYEEDLKSSPNIIDLIEAGDYVNGYKVINTGIEEEGYRYIDLDFDKECDELHWGEYGSLQNVDIKSIVTKEQFESMEYKVGE